MRFSIIITVKDLENYISRCVNSYLNQSYNDFELLVLDDGSSDNTLNKLYEFVDPRLKIYHFEENRGISIGRNYLLDKSNGDYIFFGDGDDYVLPNFLEEISNIIDSKNPDIIFMDIAQEDSLKNLHYHNYFPVGVLKNPWYIFNFTSLSTQSQVTKRDLFENVEFPEYKYYEDVGTFYKLISKCKKAYITNKYYYIHCYREDSIVNTRSKKSYLDLVEMSLNQWNFIKDNLTESGKIYQFEILKRAVKWFTLNYKYNDDCKQVYRLKELIDNNKFLEQTYTWDILG